MEVGKSLNKVGNKYECKLCDYNTCNKCDLAKHLLTLKHLSNLKDKETPPKKSDFFTCEKCNFTTLYKKDFNRHCATQKHKDIGKDKKASLEKSEFYCKHCNYETLCKQRFSRHILTEKHIKHSKKVDNLPTADNLQNSLSPSTDINTIVIEILKRQDTMNMILMEKTIEMQSNVLSIAKYQGITNSNNTNNTNNSNNNTNNQFNLQFFLNETCKDAMNIDEFVKSLQVTMEDFETTGKLGYVEGITRIILNRLNQIDTNKRPIHCTDVKRETVYIKNEDAWEKENQEKEKLQKAVKHIARMNLSQLPKWQKENPASEVLDTQENNDYIKFSKAALGGNGDKEEQRYVDKIMKNVLKEVVVAKE